jgi:hypothetical protein
MRQGLFAMLLGITMTECPEWAIGRPRTQVGRIWLR